MDAGFKRLIGIDDGFRKGDFLKARFDLKIEIEVAIPSGVRTITGKPSSCGFIAAYAFQNSPRLTDRTSVSRGAIKLICS